MIKFKKSDAIATKDKTDFGNYADGVITAKQGATHIAKNNDLESVTEDEFIEMAIWLGYWKGDGLDVANNELEKRNTRKI